jgi:hypothetical protein
MTNPSTARIASDFQNPDYLVLSTYAANTNSKLLSIVSRKLSKINFVQAANDNKLFIQIATRTLGTLTDILGAGSNRSGPKFVGALWEFLKFRKLLTYLTFHLKSITG